MFTNAEFGGTIYIDERRIYMSQKSINIRMDEKLKVQFEQFCSDVGISMTSAFCIFAKTVVRDQRIPFEISAVKDPFYSPENMARLSESIKELEETGGTIKEIDYDA